MCLNAGLQPPPTPDMLDDFDRPAAHWLQPPPAETVGDDDGNEENNQEGQAAAAPCDPWAVSGPRCDALNSHGNDLLDPMMISGRAFPVLE